MVNWPSAQYTWTDDLQYRPFDRDIDAQDAYSICNLLVSYTPSGDSHLTLKGFVKNLSDEEYVHMISASATTGFNRNTSPWAPPRTWGVEAVWDFNNFLLDILKNQVSSYERPE